MQSTKITVIVHFMGQDFETSAEVPFAVTPDEAEWFANEFRDRLIERMMAEADVNARGR